MTFLSVFQQQDSELKFAARYGIDGKKEWRLTMSLVIVFQIIVTCSDLSVLVFIFIEHC